MAPIKFEEQIKDKLERRSLSPSVEVWSKLSDKLDAHDEGKTRPFLWWLSIAASFAALVMISIFYFNNDIEENVTPILVEEQTQIEDLNNETKVLESAETEELAIEDTEETKGIKEEQNGTKHLNQPTKQKEIIKNSIDRSAVAQVKIEQPVNLKKENAELATQFDKVIADNAVAELKKIKVDKDNSVTDQHIDSLLKSAQREIFKNRIFNESSNVVNADALLQDVEEDLGQSFRTKVYEALKDGYTKVKTAVVKRNN